MLNKTLKLSSGYSIPQIGLGVYQASPDECLQAVNFALEAGYRHVDTAQLYANEKQVGEGIRTSGFSRDQIFITTKVWNSSQGYEKTKRACEESLQKLGTDYIDLYLIHAPVPSKRKETWRAMEELQKQGKVRSIGVSNYSVHHLEEMRSYTNIRPAVNQIEVHPFLQRRDIVEYCKKEGIIVEAYSPLTRGEKLTDPTLQNISQKHKKSPAQILVRWSVQKGYVVLPKSVNKNRIIENAAVDDFDLDDEDITILDGLEEQFVAGWDPTTWE